MKESPRGSFLSESFSKKIIRSVLKNGARILPVSVLVFAAVYLGGGEAENTNNSQALENKAVGVGPKDPTSPVSASSAIETKKPAAIEEQPKSLEQQAKEAALDYFLTLLNSSQSVTNTSLRGEQYALTSRILNPELINKKELTDSSRNDIVEGKLADSDVLSIEWQFSRRNPDGTSNRNYGMGKISQLKLFTAAVDPTEMDKKNGVSWKGDVSVAFSAQSRVVVPYFPATRSIFYAYNGRYKGFDEEWRSVDYERSGEYFPVWSDHGSRHIPMLRVELRDGQWKTRVHQNAGLNIPLLGVNDQPIHHPFGYTMVLEGCRSNPGCKEVLVTPR